MQKYASLQTVKHPSERTACALHEYTRNLYQHPIYHCDYETDFPPDKSLDKSQYPFQDGFIERTPKRTPNGLKTIRSDKTVFA
jgi:hypothetical protein